MQITLSKKQYQLLNDIISRDKPEIYVLGSTQSGKTYDICYAIILYAQELYRYDPNQKYYGAIVGWTIDTLKGNIVENLSTIFDQLGFKKRKKGIGDYDINWGSSDEKYLQIYNLKLFFFGFNNVTSFNKILGKPLIIEWIDEAARIYSQSDLQKSFDEFPARQMSFALNPYIKTIHSFNVEGSERHPYKIKYIDNKPNAIHYTFFPFDNPKLNTPEAMKKVTSMLTGSLREQKVYNRWVVAEGKVFTKINIIHDLNNLTFREIGIGIDYGSVNPTTFIPIALCFNELTKKWVFVRLQSYYHDPSVKGDNPTTEFYSRQLRLFIYYLKKIYPYVPITDIVIDSEATHYHNRLEADNIEHSLATKGQGSVDKEVQHLQSLMYKDILYEYEQPSITFMHEDGSFDLSGKDDTIIELQSYQFDSVKSLKEGKNCYKKELDHSIDARRYLFEKWVDEGKCPDV